MCKETERKWKDKKEKEGYTTEMPDEEPRAQPQKDADKTSAGTVIYPMLAGKYEPQTAKKKRTDIQYPCFVQPKLDGLRCITYINAVARALLHNHAPVELLIQSLISPTSFFPSLRPIHVLL
jgi:ATP-dependent DNA ligase